MVRLSLLSTIIFILSLQSSADSWAPLPKLNLEDYSVSDFTNDELDIPYYLHHFHRLANSVIEEGPNRGFIDISVWRGEDDNRPYNARVMENILSLAYFYTKDRPWNVYYHHPQLKKRLQAALNFWCNSQNEDGRFSEYGPEKWNLPGTAFATKFMGETLRLLIEDGTLDNTLLQRVSHHDRKAIEAVLNDPSLWSHGKKYTNQYSNVWAGSLAYLNLFPDDDLKAKLVDRIQKSMDTFQSPAGYFYERSGPDWQYNMGTHHSNLWMSWHYARGTDLEEMFLQKEKRWYEWLSYNAVPEPNSNDFILNRAIETRQRKTHFHREHIPTGAEGNLGDDEIESTPLAQKVKIARAYCTTKSILTEDIKQARVKLREQWPHMAKLPVGDFRAFSPYAFLHRDHIRWFPTNEQKEEAKAHIPFFAKETFIHQRVDNRHPIAFTYIKTPHYYAAFNSGEVLHSQQQYGLGLLWNKSIGAVLQSQTGSHDLAWGTRPLDQSDVYEAKSFHPTFTLEHEEIQPEAGCHDFPFSPLTITYPLADKGQKRITLSSGKIHVHIQHTGEFMEHLPLLVSDYETMQVSSNGIRVLFGDKELSVEFQGTSQAPRWNSHSVIAQKILCGIRMKAKDEIEYTFLFSSINP